MHTKQHASPTHPPRASSKVDTILDHVGETPILKLPRLARAQELPEGAKLLAKAEHLNPGGSCKDRLALALLDEAEENGLEPGDPVVEATSGNTGIALAQACALRGYDLHVVASKKVSQEKIRILRAFDATVHRTPKVPHDDPDHYTNLAPRLAESLDGTYLDQFTSRANVRVHYEHTGPELLRQTRELGHEPDAFVCGVGTGGTLTGTARYLHDHAPEAKIVLADPQGSILHDNDEPHDYLVEGIGDDHEPHLYDPNLVDEAYTISDEESFQLALQAARTEGLLIGGSSGSHLAAATRTAHELGPGAVVTTVLPDTGRNYLSTFLDEAWCHENDIDPWTPREAPQ